MLYDNLQGKAPVPKELLVEIWNTSLTTREILTRTRELLYKLHRVKYTHALIRGLYNAYGLDFRSIGTPKLEEFVLSENGIPVERITLMRVKGSGSQVPYRMVRSEKLVLNQ